jgi:NADPH2:quinone reductase
MRAIQVRQFGGLEALTVAELDEPIADAGDLVVTVTAAGVSYADVSRVAGACSPVVELPFVPGTEVVGRRPTGKVVLTLGAAGVPLPVGR